MEAEALVTGKNSKLYTIKPTQCEIESEIPNTIKEEESTSGDSQVSRYRHKSVKKNCQIMKRKPGRIPITSIIKNKTKATGVIPEVHITPQELLLKLKLNEAKRKVKSCSCLIF